MILRVSKYLTAVFIFLLVCTRLSAQKSTSHVQQVWVAYANQTRLSKHFGLWADFHLRTREDFVNRLSTGIVRLGLTYLANDNLRFTAGYAYVNHFPPDENTTVSQPEHRPWQQVQWMVNAKRSRFMHWIRLEERYRRKLVDGSSLGDGYNFNWRVRYNLLMMLPLGQHPFAKNSLSFVANNELHINFGKQIVNNYFDQNRFFIGFAFHPNKTDNIQFGYMNLFQQLPAGNRYRSLHVPRITYFHNLDLRKR